MPLLIIVIDKKAMPRYIEHTYMHIRYRGVCIFNPHIAHILTTNNIVIHLNYNDFVDKKQYLLNWRNPINLSDNSVR